MVITRGKEVTYFDADEECLSDYEQLKNARRTKKKTATADVSGSSKPVAKGKGARLVGRLAGLMRMPVDIFTDTDMATCSRAQLPHFTIVPTRPMDVTLVPQKWIMLFERSIAVNVGKRTSYLIVSLAKSGTVITGASNMRHNRRGGVKPRPYFKKLLLEMTAQQDAITATTHDQMKVAKDQLMKIWSERHIMMIKNGKEMKNWQDEQVLKKRENLEALYQRRHQSIKEKLLALDQGFVEADLPVSDPGYVALVRKPAELTPQIWNRIQPSLKALVSERWARRIQEEREKRRYNRQVKLLGLYASVVDQLLVNNPSIDPWHVKRTFPVAPDFFELPQIVAMLEDTGDVTEDAWDAVTEDLRRLALAERLGVLSILVDILDHGCLDGRSKLLVKIPFDIDAQVEEKCNTMVAKLSLATSAFWCGVCCEMMRYPNLIGHVHAGPTDFQCFSSLSSNACSSGLIMALLKSLRSDPETATYEDMGKLANYTIPGLLCSRCNANVAPTYNNFDSLVFHYVQHNRWFNQAIAAVALDLKKAYPNRKLSEPLPILRNDHDWTTSEPLVESLTLNRERAHTEAKMAFEAENREDKDDDDRGIGGEDYKREYWSSGRGHRRICKLCPVGLSTPGLQAAVMRLHIKAKHGKEGDLEVDAEIVAKTYSS
ncbi:hypothetical protein FRB98_003773, partial [Tulasnella sp. 332]